MAEYWLTGVNPSDGVKIYVKRIGPHRFWHEDRLEWVRDVAQATRFTEAQAQTNYWRLKRLMRGGYQLTTEIASPKR
ncbi:hypothetical protein [Hyphomicrobium sp.]|uniref:hypothetical protein n=1 Tax=Hyphomicrobium sp. TaxID=82 RepID=UPI001E1A1AD1|nr:hypothetical protein [Hyphomicrobium sp.]MBY0560055.1 hypothetical protein [Hyphomicrobium sp.]